MSSRCEFPLPGYLEIEPLIKTHWSSKPKTRDPSSGAIENLFSHRRTLFRHSTPLSLTIIVKRINYQTQQYKNKTKCKKFGLCFLSKVLNSAPEGDSHPFRRKMCRCFLDEPWSKKNPLCYFLLFFCGVIWLVTPSRVTDGFLDNDRKKRIKMMMKVETLGSFNFDVILCVVCVCDMTQLLQRSMCVCNTKFQPLTHLARVINMLCVYTRLTPWLGAFRYVDRIPVDSEKCSGDAELTKKYKSIDTGCADFSKWEVTNFLNKNLICCAVQPKEFFV